ncbi:MAG: hypothetical protein ACI9BW_002696 [Gammaproteobacteria bacterium]|jgi:hypothetical protein
MTKPRASIVSVSDTPYYHCVSRCVRRAFSGNCSCIALGLGILLRPISRIPAVVCGEDSYSGQSYEHRRDWFLERLATLNEVFTSLGSYRRLRRVG